MGTNGLPSTVRDFSPGAPARAAESASARVAWACAAASWRTSWLTFIEQNLGPHMLQKCASLAPSAGSVSSWKRRAVGRTEGRDDAGPQVERTPAALGDVGRRVLELGQRAQHAGRGEGGGGVRALALGCRGVGREVEHVDLVAQARELEGKQASGDAGARDADAAHSSSAS